MKILVIGGTGTGGSEVVRSLLSRNTEVLVQSRSGGKAKDLPAGAEGVVGGLLGPKPNILAV